MSQAVRIRLVHALLALLLSAGLLLPLLGALEPSFLSPAALVPAVLTILFFEACCISRRTAVAGSVLAAAALVFWLFSAGGLASLADTARAVSLRFAGVRTALPLIAGKAVPLLSVAVSLICCFACLRNVSCVPASMLCVSVILLLYLSSSPELIPWLLPALAALLLKVMTERFRETPFVPLVPWAVLLVAAAFLIAGRGTGDNAIKNKADELRQAVLDRLFFTEPRDVFSLSSEGYYPEGIEQLGGKPDPDDTPVMQVSAPRTVYLRGAIMNEYTGRNWRNTTGGRRLLWQSPRLKADRERLFDQLLPPETVLNALCEPYTVSVRMLNNSASTLFVPQRIRELKPGGELVPYFSNSSEVFITRNLQAGDTYSVSAPIFQAGDPGLGTLIEVCSTLDDSAYDRISETYTSLPAHLEEPVYALAREASSVAEAPYEKALALQSWLSRSYRYTLDVEYQPGDIDFVTHFLLDTREGYCTYFASAMTVLCRMAGLPARYVEGYIAEPDENGHAVVTGMSAHAWTEVYFRGFGWLTFDATPRTRGDGPANEGGSDPSDTPEPSPTPEPEPTPPDSENTEDETETPPPEPESTPSPEPTDGPPSPTPSPSPSPEPQARPDSGSESKAFPWYLLLLLLPLLLMVRIILTSPSVRERRAKDEEARLDVWAQEIIDLLRSENLSRHRDESPMAFGRRVDRTGIFSVALGPVGECISLIRYSRAQAQDTDTQLVRDSAVVLKNEISRPALLRYWLSRIFIPLSRRDYTA